MPVFEYVCADCQHEFEELVFSDDEEIVCPKCKSEHASKVLSMFAFKSGSKFRSSSSKGASCAGCTPSPGGCGCCGH